MKHPDESINAQQEALNNLTRSRQERSLPLCEYIKKEKPPTWKTAIQMERSKPDTDEIPKYTVRACITCTRDFKSQGPHHRMCAECRKKEACPFEGAGSTGRHKQGVSGA